MKDIVERLRGWFLTAEGVHRSPPDRDRLEAADEIVRLREEVAKLAVRLKAEERR